ncbi:hypothetical protein CYY_004898 [Polysphondylium violaceum]|uniref:Uncharacterized protein n=1 Tax=Polysphondylium violaceum TaxID=133409 RepID=A0A8J4PW24_9MYCE|nr:hypothetical protein CYY_004898 [Polysphondylium violaceum]
MSSVNDDDRLTPSARAALKRFNTFQEQNSGQQRVDDKIEGVQNQQPAKKLKSVSDDNAYVNQKQQTQIQNDIIVLDDEDTEPEDNTSQKIISIITNDDEDTEPEDNSKKSNKSNNTNSTNSNTLKPTTSVVKKLKLPPLTLKKPTSNSTSTHNQSNSGSSNSNSNSNNKKNIDPIDIDLDDEDEDLRYAIKLSLEQSNNSKQTTSTSTTTTNETLSSSTFYLNTIKNQPRIVPTKTLSIQELFANKGMKSAIITSYVFDVNWILENLYKSQGKRIPITFIKHYDSKVDKKGIFKQSETITVVHPPLMPFGCFHAKLLLLTYDDYIRVALSSANAWEHDYAVLGQTIWYQDFPKSSSSTTADPKSFGSTLKRFIKSTGLPIDFLNQFDFSDAKAVLVTSVPGYYKMTDYEGILQIKHHVTQMNAPATAPTTKDKDIYFQASSIGHNNSNWRGVFTDTLTPKTTGSRNLHIMFPTHQWIHSDATRYQNSGCMFLTEKNYQNNKSNFDVLVPRYLYRKELVLHSKIMVATSKTNDNHLRYDWVYTGSHNFSPSAWGAFQKNNTQLYISNYEIGVLILNDKNQNDKSTPEWVQHIPFQIPTTRYSAKDEPYIQSKTN